MVGQLELKNRIKQQIEDQIFPRFSILVGPDGSGKRLVACWTAQLLSDIVVPNVDIKIDSIREVIKQAYKVRGTTVFIISNADNMSVAAQNAMLKVVEEPPNNAYFIMLLNDIDNTLDTIRSRAVVFSMDQYSKDELLEYAKSITDDEFDLEVVSFICENPGEVQTLCRCGVRGFYDYVKLVIDNITVVSGANAFKIPSKVALKDGDSGYDLRLFWKMFMYTIIKERVWNGAEPEVVNQVAEALMITSRSLQDLRIRGINRQQLIDMWILDIRREWMYGCFRC